MAEKKTYKQLSEELNELVAWFEGDQVDIDTAVIKYEQAIKLLDAMETYLKTAENKIIKLRGNK